MNRREETPRFVGVREREHTGRQHSGDCMRSANARWNGRDDEENARGHGRLRTNNCYARGVSSETWAADTSA